MTLANPNALLWLALLVPIVLFYLTKVRVRQEPIGSDMFWEQVFEQKRRHAVWRRLRNLTSLLIQLVLVSLLIMALTDPVLPWEAGEPRRIVLVVDVSASMGTAESPDGGKTRLNLAVREAHRLLAGLRDRDEMALVIAGGQPQVACGLTDDRRAIREALDALAAIDAPAGLPEAVALGRRLLAGHQHGEVIALTDGCEEGTATLVEADGVRLVKVGAPLDNVGITRFQARRSLRDPTGYEILIEVCNFSATAVECRLYLELDGVVADVIPLTLPPDAVWSQVIEKASPDGGRLLARLDREDALPSDNQAWAIIPRRDPLPTTFVTADDRFSNLYVEKVLEACPLVKQPATLVVGKDRQPPAGTAITIYFRTTPAKMPDGACLVIDPQNSTDLWDVGDPAAGLIGKVDRDSPLLTHLRLENLSLAEPRRLTPKGKAQVLMSSIGEETLYFTIDRSAGRIAVLSVNLEQGDLPLRTIFPILVTNALTWLSGKPDELRESATAGGFAELTLPASSSGQELSLWPPAGAGRRLPTAAEHVTAGPLDRCGIWRVAPTQDGPALIEIACNLSNRRESDLRPESIAPGKVSERQSAWLPRSTWYYLAALALALLVGEWCLFQRRRIG